MNLLEINRISKNFGGLAAIHNVSFVLERAEICGMIGPNGAGKTTLFNLITGVYHLDAGEVLLSGKRLNGLKPHKIAELGISRTFQKIRLFRNLTVLQNVHLGQHCRTKTEVIGAILKGRGAKQEEKATQEKSMELLEFFGLQDKRNEIAKNLSYGEQRLLEIARAMAVDPLLMLLDEPSSGLNPHETDELMERIEGIREQGITILLIEHDMSLAMASTHHLVVLNFGEKIFDGSPESARKDANVIKAYLGEEYASC